MRPLICIASTAMLLIIAACTYEQPESLYGNVQEKGTEPELVTIKERNPDFPWKDRKTDYASMKKSSAQGTIELKDLIGRSWKNVVFPIDNPRNKGWEVLDQSKIPQNHYPIDKNSSIITTCNMFSFANYDRYYEKSGDSIKFEMSIGGNNNADKTKEIINANANMSYSMAFSNEYEEIEKNAFGYLAVSVEKHNHKIQVSDMLKRDAALDYLSESFKYRLYNTMPENNFIEYGGYVLTNFFSGGKAYVMYNATSKETYTTAELEGHMETEIGATFGFVSGKMSMGYSSSSISKQTSKFAENRLFIQSIGGGESLLESYGFAVLDANPIEIDLNDWIHSLNDESTNEIIEIGQKGLVRLSDFILEKNLRDRYEALYNKKDISPRTLSEPYIYIKEVYMQSPARSYKTYLVTKYGDALEIGSAVINKNTQNLSSCIDSEVQRLEGMLGLEVRTSMSLILMNSPVLNPNDSLVYNFGTYEGEYYQRSHFNESKMTKITNEDGSVYLFCYDDNDGKYYVYTIYDEHTRYDYAMTDFLDNVPEIQGTPSYIKIRKNRMFNSSHIVNVL